MTMEIVRNLTRLEKRVDNLPRPEVGHKISEDNVAVPPTDAQLDTAFPNAYNGFVGLVDDNAAALGPVWLVAMVGDSWWYEELTLAV